MWFQIFWKNQSILPKTYIEGKKLHKIIFFFYIWNQIGKSVLYDFFLL